MGIIQSPAFQNALCSSPELTPVTTSKRRWGVRELGVGQPGSWGEVTAVGSTVPVSGRVAVRAVSKHSLLSGGVPV